MAIATTLGFVGCASNTEVGTYGDLPESVRQVQFDMSTYEVGTYVDLIVVDDAPTDEARALRAFLAQDVVGSYDSWHRDNRVTGDGGAWRQVDIRTVVVSASDPKRAITSVMRPELAVISPNASAEQIAAREVALAGILQGQETAEIRPFIAAEAIEHWRGLLGGTEAAQNDDERLFLASLPAMQGGYVHVFIGTTRDDESPPESKDREVDRIDAFVEGLAWGRLGASASCAWGWEGPALLALAGKSNNWGSEWSRNGCDRTSLFKDDSAWDGQPTCTDWVPVSRPDGSVDCKMEVETSLEPCPAWAGWLDPVDAHGRRASRIVHRDYGDRRLCEVKQLEGEALAACTTDPTCKGCQAGFCYSDALDVSFWCPTNRSLGNFRFPMGADSARKGRFHITCNIETAPTLEPDRP